MSMKRLVITAGLLAALALPVAASASTAEGHLTGGALIGDSVRFVIAGPVVDGGTSFLGAEDDQSGLCDGDSGSVKVNGTRYSVICAHFVAESGNFGTGSPKMRFAYQTGPGSYTIVRITGNGSPGAQDNFGWATVTTLPEAIAWVNRGANGSGHSTEGWTFLPISEGNYSVRA
jgi:hypothetical protein